jgi:glycosyltransferase involved in cell wall biosynthesis
VIDEEIPFPLETGKRLRTVNLLKHLSGEFQIEVLVHGNGATPSARETMRRLGLHVHVAPSFIPAKRGPAFPFHLLRNLVSPLPYSVASHLRRGYRDHLTRLLETGGFDLVHCEWTPYAAYLFEKRIPVVVSAHNIESDIWKRMEATEENPLRRSYIGLQAKRMQRFERRVFSSFPFATAVSEGDAAGIRTLGCSAVEVVPNGVDLDYFSFRDLPASTSNTLVFTGSMDWRPNQDAIRWFVAEIHPRLAREIDYKLMVVGRNPPPWLSRITAQIPQIVVTGTVDDVRPFIETSDLYVVPIRAGGGSRLKILEAMAMGRPVVSTRVGAEGIAAESGRHIELVEDPDAFASETVRLLADVRNRRNLAREGRALIEEKYRWSSIAARQGDLWRRVIAESAGPPSP